MKKFWSKFVIKKFDVRFTKPNLNFPYRIHIEHLKINPSILIYAVREIMICEIYHFSENFLVAFKLTASLQKCFRNDTSAADARLLNNIRAKAILKLDPRILYELS